MDRSTAAELEKLSKALTAIAESMAQLQLDVAKLDARVVAIDSQVAAIGRRLDRLVIQEEDEKSQRDLDLERQVFGEPRTQKAASKRWEKEQQHENQRSTPRKRISARSRKGKATTRWVGRRR